MTTTAGSSNNVIQFMKMPSLAEIAAKLGGRVCGDQVKAPGPGHSAADDSLSVKPDANADGGFIICSHSGDNWKVCRDHVRSKLGLPPFEPKGNGGSEPWKLIDQYIYKTENGEPYLLVKKFLDGNDKNQFPQYHLEGGTWTTGKPKGPKVPYRLPELLTAAPTMPVFFCEGEKDAENLAKLGFIATTASEGAGAKWAPELTAYFKDRPVIILPDADDPGRRHAQKVAAALDKTATSIKILELYPNHHEGEDVSDWLKDDRVGARLVQMAKSAPLWEPVDEKPSDQGADHSKTDEDENFINQLAALPLLQYEKRREQAAKQLGIKRLPILDKLVEAARGTISGEKETIAPDREALAQSAADIIASGNILDLFGKDFSKVIAGESANGKLLYLICTSRLFEQAMHAAIKGPSAGGKSEIRKRVLKFLPPESVVSFTSLSEKALIYHQGDFDHKILSMGEANATEEQNFQDYLLRELMSEGHIRYPTVQKVGNELVTVFIEKRGPVAFLVTTTKNKLHPENETRMLSMEVDDSEGQTKAVLEKVAKVEGRNKGTPQIDYKPWQDFQRWLEAGERDVDVPFADALAAMIPPKAVRLRRDFGQVLRAIKAHALLHRQHRSRDGSGQIVADIHKDYAVVRDLMHAILAEGAGVAVSKMTAETIAAVEQATINLSDEQGATGQDISKVLKLDRSTAIRRLSAARSEGFVVNLEVRRGMPGKYRTTDQAAKIEPDMDILPDPEELEAYTLSQSPPKTAQPCNREEKADTDQEDNGCKPPCNCHATAQPEQPERLHGCETVADPLATVKSMNSQEESPPVARLHEFPGGMSTMLCLECHTPIRPGDGVTVRSTSDGQIAAVHDGGCFDRWRGAAVMRFPEQISTEFTTIEEIMSRPTFALGVADARAGRLYHPDYDLWDTDGQWDYERGRQWAALAPQDIPLKRGGKITAEAIGFFQQEII
jgi:5S rRNA maturation endonuclease (ribonuclease M5)